MDTFKSVIHPIHREGYIFILIFAVAALLLGTLIYEPLGWIGGIATCWCIYFFRDPDRVTPEGKDLVISPADGLVQMITRAAPPKELNMGDEERTRISVFLNVFNVHVNRSPIAGTVTASHYHPGKFFNASLDKASINNERQSILITTEDDKEIICVQIAGLVARRIVCDLENNDTIGAGQRFGIIRFGSRTDIYLPEGVTPQVVVGQIMVGGETILADLSSNAPERKGKRH